MSAQVFFAVIAVLNAITAVLLTWVVFAITSTDRRLRQLRHDFETSRETEAKKKRLEEWNKRR